MRAPPPSCGWRRRWSGGWKRSLIPRRYVVVARGGGSLVAKLVALVASAAMLVCTSSGAAAQDRPWLDPKLPPEARAKAAVAAMTLDEKLRLVFGYSDQALTDVAKVPDEIVSPELK